MGEIDGESQTTLERSYELCRFAFRDLPGRVAPEAGQVTVLHVRQDMELLAPVGRVTMAEEADLLEHVERAVDRRGDGRRIQLTAALDEFGTCDVAVGPGKDLDEHATLRGPAQSAGVQSLANRRPRVARRGACRSGDSHRAEV